MPRPPNQKVVVIPLVTNLLLQTNRTTTNTAIPLELGDFEAWGPYLQSIRVVTVTRNRTANHAWKAVLQWSADGTTFSSAVDLFAEITADAQVIQLPYTTKENLAAPQLRVSLATRNTVGTALESAIVSALAIVTFES